MEKKKKKCRRQRYRGHQKNTTHRLQLSRTHRDWLKWQSWSLNGSVLGPVTLLWLLAWYFRKNPNSGSGLLPVLGPFFSYWVVSTNLDTGFVSSHLTCYVCWILGGLFFSIGKLRRNGSGEERMWGVREGKLKLGCIENKQKCFKRLVFGSK